MLGCANLIKKLTPPNPRRGNYCLKVKKAPYLQRAKSLKYGNIIHYFPSLLSLEPNKGGISTNWCNIFRFLLHRKDRIKI